MFCCCCAEGSNDDMVTIDFVNATANLETNLTEQDGFCPYCGSVLDRRGDHALVCRCGGGRTILHNAFQDCDAATVAMAAGDPELDPLWGRLTADALSDRESDEGPSPASRAAAADFAAHEERARCLERRLPVLTLTPLEEEEADACAPAVSSTAPPGPQKKLISNAVDKEALMLPMLFISKTTYQAEVPRECFKLPSSEALAFEEPKAEPVKAEEPPKVEEPAKAEDSAKAEEPAKVEESAKKEVPPQEPRAAREFDVTVERRMGDTVGLMLASKTAGLRIVDIVPGKLKEVNSAAAPDRRIEKHDFILEVNGKSTQGGGKNDAMAIIQGISWTLKLKMHRPLEYTVTIAKSAKPFGALLGYQMHIPAIEITAIRDGALKDYNATAGPEAQVKVIDTIIAVNGIADTAVAMVEAIRSRAEIVLTLVRPPAVP
mmetsp:Transcript_1766/g.4459  ORF Transcript_1766/g.4459 Transcript_1766/m.4459 type:complete len:433 (+) Transcript_1766:95-1393(+)